MPLALAFVLISAYREELYFRAYLLTVLEEIATPPWLAVLTSALLFGLGHLYQGWLAAVTALLIGVGFALLYRHRPSVHRLAWAHAAFNREIVVDDRRSLLDPTGPRALRRSRPSRCP